MSDLISRNALLDAMPKNDELLSVDVRRIICESPNVDAESVRHGKCDFCGRGKPIKAYTYLPDCGLQYGIAVEAIYCPNCGARIRGDEDA